MHRTIKVSIKSLTVICTNVSTSIHQGPILIFFFSTHKISDSNNVISAFYLDLFNSYAVAEGVFFYLHLCLIFNPISFVVNDNYIYIAMATVLSQVLIYSSVNPGQSF